MSWLRGSPTEPPEPAPLPLVTARLSGERSFNTERTTRIGAAEYSTHAARTAIAVLGQRAGMGTAAMESFFSRAAVTVAELSDVEDRRWIAVAEIHDAMAARWPQAFPRPLRQVDAWCREAVEHGLLAARVPRDERGRARDWGAEEYGPPGVT